MPDLEELWRIVESIPRGRVASYGSVGRAMRNPASGYMVGRWMANCPSDVPWWRVVSKQGLMPVWKRNPDAELEQISRLLAEGVEVVDGRIDMHRFAWEEE
jgi:methylated-DNA-protein-cysteine methyltransferase-like protein